MVTKIQNIQIQHLPPLCLEQEGKETDDYVNVEKIARNLRPKIFFCLELEFVVRDFDVGMHAVVPVEVV